MRDCTRLGHVLVDSDTACLSCGYEVRNGDTVAYHVKACATCKGWHTPDDPHLGEMLTPADVAAQPEWAGLPDPEPPKE